MRSGASAKRCCSRELRDHNVKAIKASGAKRIVTADPHAYNALKNDYKDVPPVEHISQVIARQLKAGKIKFKPVENSPPYTPTTTRATWAGTTKSMTIPELCSMPSLV